MSAAEFVVDLTLTDRGQEMRRRLERLKNQAVRGSRSKMSRLMRRGARLAWRYMRSGSDLVAFHMIGPAHEETHCQAESEAAG